MWKAIVCYSSHYSVTSALTSSSQGAVQNGPSVSMNGSGGLGDQRVCLSLQGQWQRSREPSDHSHHKISCLKALGPQPLLRLRLPAGAPAWTPLCYQLDTRCFSGYCGKTVQGMSCNLGFSLMSALKTDGEREREKMPCLVTAHYSLWGFFSCLSKKETMSPPSGFLLRAEIWKKSDQVLLWLVNG